MKKRLVLILGLIVLLPLVVLIGFGVALARQEKARVQARYEQVLFERLGDINAGVAKLLGTRERELLRALTLPSYDTEAIRDRVRGSRLLRQIFVIASDGRLLHPRQREALTADEQAFLGRTASLWESGESFWSPVENTGAKGKRAAAPSFGWHPWFWGEGLRLIFWLRLPSGDIVGAEVERAAIMADVIGQLPVGAGSRTALSEGRIVLVNAHSRPLYQWGDYAPAVDEAPTVTQPLPAPLSAWNLRYYVPTNGIGRAIGRSAMFNIAAGLAALALSLIVLAVYFYRESSRDMHEAARRVSFVNQVSHELKTPLTNIRMYAELLDNRIPGDDTRSRGYVGVLVSETQRLSRLITNVLTFASHRRGKLRLHTQPVNVDKVIEAVTETFKPALDALGIHVQLEGNADRCVALDVDALEQILGNLISNVEKYATRATTLRIVRRQEADTTTITVSDNGVGIPAAQRETIFQPFVRLSNKLTDGVTGTGIGLAIARQLAALHGGGLDLLPGVGGATFELTLNTPEMKP